MLLLAPSRLGGFVQAAPVHDLFANRIGLSGSNLVVTSSNAGATQELSEPFRATSDGGKSVWWAWTAPFSGKVTVATTGSGFDTLLAVYTGSSLAQLTEVAFSDDESTSLLTSRIVLIVNQGQTYQILVDGYNDGSGAASGSIRLQVTLAEALAAAWTLTDVNNRATHSAAFAGQVIIYHQPQQSHRAAVCGLAEPGDL